jgi:DNA-binding beta-propeller fold protein YncE
LAYVTPGGAGVMSVVNLQQANASVKITSAVRTNNIVTVTTTDPNGINPALGGTVLISNLTPTDLNGTFPVLLGSITNYTFQYFLTGANESSTSATQGTVQYGNPYYTFFTTNTTTGAAINPVTRTFGFADYNASVAQIGFIQTLDLGTTSLTLNAGGYLGNPSSAPEIGLRFVDWDPYRNLLIAFNPSDNTSSSVGNEVSIINPGGPSLNGTLAQPYRIIAPIKTNGVGTGTLTPAGQGATPVTVFGAMAYDPATKLVLVGNAGSNTLTYINLDPSAQFKPVQVQSVQVISGGVPNTQPNLPGTPITTSCTSPPAQPPYLPQSALAGCTSAAVHILGTGFKTPGTVQVRLDQNSSGITFVVINDGEIDATIPASYLDVPHNYALDVVVNGATNTYTSNSVDFGVVGFTDLYGECTASGGVEPEGVAIDDVINIGFVTLYGCNTGSVSIINLDVNNIHNYGKPYGAVLKTLQVGKGPIGVDVIPRLGYAVVSNNGDSPGTVSIIQYTDTPVFDAKVLAFTTGTTTSSTVTVGTAPSGVAIDQDHAYALIANSGSSTVSYIDLTVLQKSTPGTPVSVPIATDPQPKAIAVDPNRQIAVVTALLTAGAGGVCGALDVITLNGTPVKNNAASICSLIATPTGIVYDPAVSPALFYATSTQSNALYAFNPDTSGVQRIPVGINPYGVAYNYQTGTLLSVNSTSNTMSIIGSQIGKTRGTLAIGSQSQFPAAMDNINNTVVIVDQNNDRVLMIPMPH